jgi:flagellar basal-body rod protein FlgC
MSDQLLSTLRISGAGLSAQSERLRVISENVANAQSVGATPGADPYARKTISFSAIADGMGQSVKVSRIGLDSAPPRLELDPGNPAADDKGYVKKPNIDLLTELADMREANRSYEANLQIAKQAGELFSMTVNMMRDS